MAMLPGVCRCSDSLCSMGDQRWQTRSNSGCGVGMPCADATCGGACVRIRSLCFILFSSLDQNFTPSSLALPLMWDGRECSENLEVQPAVLAFLWPPVQATHSPLLGVFSEGKVHLLSPCGSCSSHIIFIIQILLDSQKSRCKAFLRAFIKLF